MRWLFIIFTLLAPSVATAANITTGTESGVKWVSIEGKIDYGDDKVFFDKIIGTPEAVVFLSSPGGNVVSGIAIGTAIHERHYATVVPRDAECASICGLIWLGGTKRLLGDNAQVGFHAAYSVTNGVPEVSSVANALLGSYYARIGLSDRTIMYLTTAGPRDMRWLNKADAQTNEIAFVHVPRDVEPAGDVPTPGAAAPEIREAQAPVEKRQLPALTVAEAPIAARLTRRFNARVQEAGMSGVDVSIGVCYKKAIELSSWDSAVYCTALDVLAMIVDSQLAEAAHLPPSQKNARPAVVWRSNRVATALGYPADLLRERGAAVALVAASKIDTTEDPGEPVQVVAQKDFLIENKTVSKKVRGNSPCSEMAHEWGQLDKGLGHLVGGFCGAVAP